VDPIDEAVCERKKSQRLCKKRAPKGRVRQNRLSVHSPPHHGGKATLPRVMPAGMPSYLQER
jgi:hypothetical protein